MFKLFFKKKTKKIWFDGRTNKLSIKSKLLNFRFNRSNKCIVVFNRNLIFIKHRFKRKIYIHNNTNLYDKNKLIRDLFKVRKYDCYTLRGSYISEKVIKRKQGRVSGYI